MEWVPAKNGEIPFGRRPIEGGYESGWEELCHALGKTDDMRVSGKADNGHPTSGSITSTSLCLTFPLDYVIGTSKGLRENTSWLLRTHHLRVQNPVSNNPSAMCSNLRLV